MAPASSAPQAWGDQGCGTKLPLQLKLAILNLLESWLVGTDGPQAAGILDPKVAWHDSLFIDPAGGLDPLPGGITGLQRWRSLMTTAFPDLELSVEELQPAEAGHALLYWTMRGTHAGPLYCLPEAVQPTGRAFAVCGSAVLRFRQESTNGHVAEEVWFNWDPLLLFQQLGLPPVASADGSGACTDAQHATSQPAAGVPAAGPASAAEAATAAANAAALVLQGQAAAGNALAAAASAAAAAVEAAAAGESAASAAMAAADAARTAAGAAAAAARSAGAAQPPLGPAPPGLDAMAVAAEYFRIYNSGDFSSLDAIVHPDYRYDGLLDLGALRGAAAMRAMMSGWRDAAPDMRLSSEFLLLAGGDRILFRWVIQGTHTGKPFNGQAASGRPLLAKGVTALTLTNGRISRKVSHANGEHVLRQLGLTGAPCVSLPPA